MEMAKWQMAANPNLDWYHFQQFWLRGTVTMLMWETLRDPSHKCSTRQLRVDNKVELPSILQICEKWKARCNSTLQLFPTCQWLWNSTRQFFAHFNQSGKVTFWDRPFQLPLHQVKEYYALMISSQFLTVLSRSQLRSQLASTFSRWIVLHFHLTGRKDWVISNKNLGSEDYPGCIHCPLSWDQNYRTWAKNNISWLSNA